MNPFLLVAIKLLIGFFAMVIIINLSGKGNLAPSSASDQIVNISKSENRRRGLRWRSRLRQLKQYSLCRYYWFLLSMKMGPLMLWNTNGIGVIGKVIRTSVEEEHLNGDKVDIDSVEAIAFDPYTNGYYRVGNRVGDAFKDGLKLK